MLKVLISGALGKMGKKVFDRISAVDGVCAVCGVDISENLSNPQFPVYSSFENVKESVDVVIDFSTPKNLDAIVKFCLSNKIPSVLCTTGYDEIETAKINELAKKTAVFRSANMSLGVNALIKAVKTVAKALYGFDVEIIEKHHNQKVDAPSGTALMLAGSVKEVYPEKYYVNGRNGIVGKRNGNEIGIHAVRGGNIVGEHEVIFAGENETVTLSHQATDRGVFAVGAVRAAQFIVNKEKGLYDYDDLLSE